MIDTIALRFVEANGRTTDLDVIPEGSLMEVAVRGGVDGIVAQCGGACACGTCHVYIEMVGDRLVAPLGGLEAEMLECVSDRRASSRQIGSASCRGRVCQYVEIQVGAVSLKNKTQDKRYTAELTNKANN